jgi:hypothetical protein
LVFFFGGLYTFYIYLASSPVIKRGRMLSPSHSEPTTR